MIYWDTSAFLKGFIQEEGSKRVLELLGRPEPMFTSSILELESYVSLQHRQRRGELTSRQMQIQWRSVVRLKAKLSWIPLSETLMREGRRMARRHPLRTLDLIHLASATMTKRALGESLTFVSSDHSLLQAAEREGLVILDPEMV